MNNQISNFRFQISNLRRCLVLLCTFALMLLCTILTGCEQFPGDEQFYEIKIAPEKLRQVETLELQKAEVKENGRPEPNAVPLKELGLTLEQCRALTLENNLDLKVQLISPAIAAERVSEQEAAFEAAFFSNTTYARIDTPVASTIDIAGSKVNYLYTDLGVRVPLRTGGTVRFDLAEYQIALVDLSYATGTLLGAAKMQWEPIVPLSKTNSF